MWWSSGRVPPGSRRRRNAPRGGLSFKVFEAMNRIGGRAWTSDQHFGAPFDIGCAWLHAADRNPYYAEAEAAGWTLHTTT